jgi:AraC family transcriptional regulator
MDGRIQRVLTIIGNNLHKKVSLNKLAQSVNLSPWHLHRLFKAETGVPPAKYIKQLRMQRASQLLEDTFLSLKEIMLKIGVHDESHFIRDFRAIYGLTPIRYRTRFLASRRK